MSEKHQNIHFLCTTLQVSAGLILGGEYTGRLDDVLSTSILPRDLGGITVLVHLDSLVIDNEVTSFRGDATLEVAVGRIILQHVDL